MAIYSDIAQEKAKLVKVMNRSKLAKSITDGILMPILDQLEDDARYIMEEAAQMLVDRIKDYMIASTPSGRTYKIVSMEGGKGTVLGEHTASRSGEPPAMLSGTLVESIGYEMFSDGSFVVGLLPQWGDFSDTMSEFASSGFSIKTGSIIINGKSEMKQTPVGTYGRALEGGFTNAKTGKYVEPRPWFKPIMDELKEPLRQMIRKSVRKSLGQITRRYSIKRAIVFKVYYR